MRGSSDPLPPEAARDARRPSGRFHASWLGSAALAFAALALAGCAGGEDGSGQGPFARYPERLSAWGLFVGEQADHIPAAGVEPYDLNTALFSDYALKFRFMRLPDGPGGAVVPAQYRETGPFEFPVGTVISKTFAYPADFRVPTSLQAPEGSLRPLETRLLVHEEDGWVGLPYIWNAELTDAELAIAGGPLDVSWIDAGGSRIEHAYRVPNANQCKTCHRTDGERVLPIGPQAALLNREYTYPDQDGTTLPENQIERWRRIGFLEGAPPAAETPRAPVWNRASSGSVDERARTWLDINCAHCHNLTGSGRTSGLDLRKDHQNRTRLGVYKHPVAAGLGTGDRIYAVVPGKPDESILLYRLESTHPGIAMPEIGRGLVDVEAVALIRQWILEMEPRDSGNGPDRTPWRGDAPPDSLHARRLWS